MGWASLGNNSPIRNEEIACLIIHFGPMVWSLFYVLLAAGLAVVFSRPLWIIFKDWMYNIYDFWLVLWFLKGILRRLNPWKKTPGKATKII